MSGWDEGAVYYSDQALAGDDGSGARGEAGTDSNHSLIQKFKEFIRNFETTNNVLPYRESLLHNPKFLLVDMGDLDTFDSELPAKLRSNPADVLPLVLLSLSSSLSLSLPNCTCFPIIPELLWLYEPKLFFGTTHINCW